MNIKIEKKTKPVHFSPNCTKPVHFLSPHFVRKRSRPQIRVRMQANDDNDNEDDALEGLALLEQQNPYQGAPIHREEQFINSIWSKKRRVSYTSTSLLAKKRTQYLKVSSAIN